MSSLDIFIGPMFSGKSTNLTNKLLQYQYGGKNILAVNHTYDTRSLNQIKTHNGITFPAIKTHQLMLLIDTPEYNNSSIIGIDEAQFFNDLRNFVIYVLEKSDKKIIVSGLDSDFKREKFGQLLDIIPLADSIVKLTSICTIKLDDNSVCGNTAIFTKRLNNSKKQIVIGAKETYIPVCRNHF